MAESGFGLGGVTGERSAIAADGLSLAAVGPAGQSETPPARSLRSAMPGDRWLESDRISPSDRQDTSSRYPRTAASSRGESLRRVPGREPRSEERRVGEE